MQHFMDIRYLIVAQWLITPFNGIYPRESTGNFPSLSIGFLLLPVPFDPITHWALVSKTGEFSLH